MKTCKDCIHYDCCHYHITEETSMTIEECSTGFLGKDDVAPIVHGEWEVYTEHSIFGLYQVGWRCSLCGRTESYKQPYCNCGARMDGGK